MNTFSVAANGATFSVESQGEGRLVVLLHAGICDKRMWSPQLAAIGEDQQAVAYDRRGFGATQVGRGDYSAVDDLFQVIDAVSSGQSSVVLVGCSQGARIVLDAALMHPSRVDGLVLISPTVSGSPDPVYPPDLLSLVSELARVGQSGDLDALNTLKARIFLDGAMSFEGRVTGALRNLFLDMNGKALRLSAGGASRDAVDAFQGLERIEPPTLVIWGDLDYPHIQARAQEVARRLPRGYGQEISGAAHLPSMEQPELVNDLVLDLLQRCDRHD